MTETICTEKTVPCSRCGYLIIMKIMPQILPPHPDLTGIREVYEKYKHLDGPLSDEYIDSDDDFPGHIRYELWQAVKGICKEKQ